MELNEILSSTFNKTKKAFLLFDAGYTRRDVANWVTNGNYGFAHNIWKKWNTLQTGATENEPINISPFEFTFNRTFGIELEIYGADHTRLINEFAAQGITLVSEEYNHSVRTHWKIVHDGSVTGPNACEIVSPVLQGAEGLDVLKRATIALRKADAKVNNSCGFHVHFGVSDFTLDNFKMLAKNHIKLEGGFDKLVPESRREYKNTYCQGLKMNRSASYINSKINQAQTIGEFVNIFHSRYLKLNFQSYTRQGTVEVSHHSGTTTYSKIKNWILICARLIEFSKASRFANNLNEILNDTLKEYPEDRAIDLAA